MGPRAEPTPSAASARCRGDTVHSTSSTRPGNMIPRRQPFRRPWLQSSPVYFPENSASASASPRPRCSGWRRITPAGAGPPGKPSRAPRSPPNHVATATASPTWPGVSPGRRSSRDQWDHAILPCAMSTPKLNPARKAGSTRRPGHSEHFPRSRFLARAPSRPGVAPWVRKTACRKQTVDNPEGARGPRSFEGRPRLVGKAALKPAALQDWPAAARRAAANPRGGMQGYAAGR